MAHRKTVSPGRGRQHPSWGALGGAGFKKVYYANARLRFPFKEISPAFHPAPQPPGPGEGALFHRPPPMDDARPLPEEGPVVVKGIMSRLEQ
eukprot:2751977-Pyramimonas_sp.AAC.1